MRRMVNTNNLQLKPKLIFEDELINTADIPVKLEKGRYIIDLYQSKADSCNTCYLTVGEAGLSYSSFSQFNPGIVGAAIGCYFYDTTGELLEIMDTNEGMITVNGHIDIYKL